MSVSLARRILAERLVPPEALHRALLESLRRATPLLEVLIETRRELAPALGDLLAARHAQAPRSWQPDRALVAQLPPGMCERLLAFPIRAGAGGEVEVAAADPSDPHIVREFVAHLGRTIITVASPLPQIFRIAGVRIVPPLPDYSPGASEVPIPLVRRSAGSRPRVEPSVKATEDHLPISPMPSRPVTAPPPAESAERSRATPVTVVERPSAQVVSPRGAPTRVSVAPVSPETSKAPGTRVPTSRGLQSPAAPTRDAQRPAAPKTLFDAPRPDIAAAPKAPAAATKPATPAKTKTGLTPSPGAVRSQAPTPAKVATAVGKEQTPSPGAVRSQAPAPAKPASAVGKQAPAPALLETTPEAPRPISVARTEATSFEVQPSPRAPASQFRPAVPLSSKAPAPPPARPSAPRSSPEEIEEHLRAAEHPDDVARALGRGGGAGALVFAVRPDQFVVRAVGGQTERPELSVTREGPSVMRVAVEQDEYLGPLFDAPPHAPLFAWISAGTPVFAASVKLRDRATLVLVLAAGRSEDETRKFGRKVAELAAKSLEELIVRRKRTSRP